MRDVGKNYKLLEGGTGDAILLYNLSGPYAGIMHGSVGSLLRWDRERDGKELCRHRDEQGPDPGKPCAIRFQPKFIQYDTKPPLLPHSNGAPTTRLSSIPALDGILTQQRTGRLGR